MWALNNQTPFAAERCWVRDKNGAEVWLVAVKGTFDVLPDGTLMISEEQEEVIMAPEFSGDPLSSSLLSDTDLPHKKLATDVLVSGHACAPQGKAVKKLKVGLRVAQIQKVVHVTGDRRWLESSSGVKISDPMPFTQIPLTYERAFGGMDLSSEDPSEHDWDTRNPSGCGYATKPEHVLGKPVPNIEEPGSLISRFGQRPNPIGFGPIAGHWSQRVELAGTYDEHWEKTRQPLLPEDFDERYYQCAPLDQQIPGYLKGGEKVELYNVTPEGMWVFNLPKVYLAFTTDFDDGSSESHRPKLHTVLLKSDERQVVMVWHSHLECHHKVLKLNQTRIRLKQRVDLSGRKLEGAITA